MKLELEIHTSDATQTIVAFGRPEDKQTMIQAAVDSVRGQGHKVVAAYSIENDKRRLELFDIHVHSCTECEMSTKHFTTDKCPMPERFVCAACNPETRKILDNAIDPFMEA